MNSSSKSHCRRRKNPPSTSSTYYEAREWAALPYDVLLNIFLRLQSCAIIWGVQAVCKAWQSVTVEEPMLWRNVHVTTVPEWSSINIAVRDIVDRSAGQCEAFSGPWDNESLLYLAKRSPSLKILHIHLSCVVSTSYEVLIEAIKKLPLLEDLEISPRYQHSYACEMLFESICKARPLLKNLKIRFIMPFGYPFENICSDGNIYRTPMMSELRSLELCNYIYDGVALNAILDNCPLLESLNIAGLFVDGTMDAQLHAKCARVKNLSLSIVKNMNLLINIYAVRLNYSSDEEDSQEDDENSEEQDT